MNVGTVVVLLPALDEEANVVQVVEGFRAEGARALVVDNGSVDRTAERARSAGAEVIGEPVRGYGRACLAGIRHLRGDPPAVVVFADCDGSADPRALPSLVTPILQGRADMILGAPDPRAGVAGAIHQAMGNHAVNAIVRVLYGTVPPVTSPYRAVSWACLHRLGLREVSYGLPVETACRALRRGVRVLRVPIRPRARSGGKSKVAGTLGGTVRAATSMVRVAFRVRLERGVDT